MVQGASDIKGAAGPSVVTGERGRTRPQEDMSMIGDQHPCETTRLSLLNDPPQSVQEVFSVPVTFKNPPPLDPPHHHMM
jgi:hypothetical protein